MKKRNLKKRKKSDDKLQEQSKNIAKEQEYGDMRTKNMKRCIFGAAIALLIIFCLASYAFTAKYWYLIFADIIAIFSTGKELLANKMGIMAFMAAIGTLVSFFYSLVLYRIIFGKK